MSTGRFASVDIERSPVAASENGHFQLYRRYSKEPCADCAGEGMRFGHHCKTCNGAKLALSDEWQLFCYIEKDRFSMGRFAEDSGRKILAYASAFPTRARAAVCKLHYEGEEGELEIFVEQALKNTVKQMLDCHAVITLDLRMFGDLPDVQAYIESRLAHLSKTRNLKVEVTDNANHTTTAR